MSVFSTSHISDEIRSSYAVRKAPPRSEVIRFAAVAPPRLLWPQVWQQLIPSRLRPTAARPHPSVHPSSPSHHVRSTALSTSTTGPRPGRCVTGNMNTEHSCETHDMDCKASLAADPSSRAEVGKESINRSIVRVEKRERDNQKLVRLRSHPTSAVLLFLP